MFYFIQSYLDALNTLLIRYVVQFHGKIITESQLDTRKVSQTLLYFSLSYPIWIHCDNNQSQHLWIKIDVHKKNKTLTKTTKLIEYINLFCLLCCLVYFQDGFIFIVAVVVVVGTEFVSSYLKKTTSWRCDDSMKYSIFHVFDFSMAGC